MSERSEVMAAVRPLGSGTPMGSGGAGTRRGMSERSEVMAAVRPLGSRTRMGFGGAAPAET